MLKTAVGRFRMIAFAEGISFLTLLLIAMPLKYFADLPIAVLIVGSIHGGLFLLYLLAVAHVAYNERWLIRQVIEALIASVLPFGNFLFEARMRRVYNQRA